ncbi:MAG: tetratricopeptide repeat protein [Actinomycetales bacterium]|nr:tetratricopeptide repeat protein [Actinomycetales bacterium]
MNTLRRLVSLPWLLTWFSLAALITALVVSPLGSFAANALPIAPAARALDDGADRPSGLALTALPTFVSGALVPAGQRPEWLDDSRQVNAKVEEWFGASGHADLVDSFWSAVEKGALSADLEAYPYDFGDIDRVVAALIPADATAVQRDQFNDLAGLVMLLGERGDVKADPIRHNWAPAAAYSILNRLRTVGAPSCPIQLNLAFATTLRESAPQEAVEREFRTAMELCGGDPTPAYYLGIDRLIRNLTADSCPEASLLPSDLAAGAINIFRSVQGVPRSDALGRIGEAGAQLALSWEADRLSAPFTERAGYRRVLELLGPVTLTNSDPTYLTLAANAHLGLGDSGQAADLLARAVALTGTASPSVTETYARALEGSSRYPALYDFYRSHLDPPHRSAVNGSFPAIRIAVGHQAAEFPGLDVMASITRVLLDGGCGGGDTVDIGFIPAYRTGALVGSTCQRAHIVDGQQAAWLAGRTPSGLPRFSENPCDPSALTASMAALASADPALQRAWSPAGPDEETFDALVTIYRYRGLLERARAVAEDWVRVQPGSGLARDTLGEVKFLSEDYTGAAADFEAAAALFTQTPPPPVDPYLSGGRGDVGVSWSLLRKVAALLQGGQREPARAVLQSLRPAAEQGRGSDNELEVALGSYISDALGVDALRRGDYEASARHFQDSLAPKQNHQLPDYSLQVFHGSQENNLALALTKLGRNPEAQESARAAVAHDPSNPIFAETLAFAMGDGEPSKAVVAYREALAKDPTLYSSWNNLGVLLASNGSRDEAEDAFRHAVGVNPDYAVGWFNLGVILRDSANPIDLVRGHGALGRAALLDSELRGQSPVLQIDDEIYETGLDLSKPLAPTWQFSDAARLNAEPFALMAFLAGLLRLVWALLYDELGGGSVNGWCAAESTAVGMPPSPGIACRPGLPWWSPPWCSSSP